MAIEYDTLPRARHLTWICIFSGATCFDRCCSTGEFIRAEQTVEQIVLEGRAVSIS